MNKISRRTIDWASFESELTSLINSYRVENSCDMPDFLIADMLCSYLKVFGPVSKQNLDWHGCPKKTEETS